MSFLASSDPVVCAQIRVDDIVRLFDSRCLKVPAFKCTSKFIEAVLNRNGYSGVKVIFDKENMYKPTVISAKFEGEE